MIQQTNVFTYCVGEEVVVLLDEVDVFDLERKTMIPPALLPAWTIGRISCAIVREGRPSYVLTTELLCQPCICVIGEAQIEGIA